MVKAYRQKTKKKLVIISIVIVLAIIAIGYGLVVLAKHVNIPFLSNYLYPVNKGNGLSINKAYSLNGKMYYVEDRDIWIYEGTTTKRLTNIKDIQAFDISSDESKLIYSTTPGDFTDLYLYNILDSSKKQLTDNTIGKTGPSGWGKLTWNNWASDPAFNSDGTKILYISDENKFNEVEGSDIPDLCVYEMNLTTKKSVRHTIGKAFTGGDQDPTYYPLDDNYFIYTKYVYDNNSQPQPYSQMYLYDKSKGAKIVGYQGIPMGEEGILQQSFSKDGKYITYLKRDEKDNKSVNVYIMPFDINMMTQINASDLLDAAYKKATLLYKGLNARPVLSPDNSQIAFLTSDNGGFDIVISDLKFTTNEEGVTTIIATKPQQITTSNKVNAQGKLIWVK